MTNGKWGRQIHRAIVRRDAATLRRMAVAADREEARMWLTLLAGMLELDAQRRRQPQMQTGGLVALPPTRRDTIRRAV